MITFRTAIAAVLNQTTSAWISTDYAVAPFWPSALNEPPLGSIFTGLSPQNWSSRTTVYQAELNCVPMSLAQTGNYTWVAPFAPNTTETYSNLTFEATSDDGCSIVFSGTPGINKVLSNSGGWWAPFPYTKLSPGLKTNNATLSACANRSMLLVGIAKNMVTGNCHGYCYGEDAPYFDTKIQLCSSQYFSGSADATVLINQTSTTVVFDVEDYKRKRKLMPDTEYNSSTMESAFFSSSWSDKFGRNDGILYNNGDEPWYGGPLSVISAGPKYDTDSHRIYNSTSLLRDAKNLLQQFLGEMLMDKWKQRANEDTATSTAEVTTSKSRVVANKDVGITLAILLLLSGMAILHAFYTTRVAQRPLGLYQDPGKIEAVATLILGDSVLREQLSDTDVLSQECISLRLEGYVLSMIRGRLQILRHEDDRSCSDKTPPTLIPTVGDPRPAVLRLRVGIPLVCFLLLLLVGLAVLYNLSSKTGLYQTSLVYQIHIDLAHASATLAPYSVIPTFLAIGAKLWFAMASDTVQRYQPFLAMIKTPTELSKSVSVEYLNTPTALVSLKALRSSHWLLALLGAGTLATEAFTVSMSALWYREVRGIVYALNATTPLILRETPNTQNATLNDESYLLSANETRKLFISDLYHISLQNWLYGATIEITQSAATPAWSKDVWSFLPRSTTNSMNSARLHTIDAHTRNITMPTTALRASLTCRPETYPADPSLWLTKIDFQHSDRDNETGNPLWNKTNSPSDLEYGYILKNVSGATFNLESIDCCANQTLGGTGSANVGYWSNANGPILTSTWIDGSPIEGHYTPYYTENNNIDTLPEAANKDPVAIVGPLKPELFVWQEPPRMVAISCEPRIEEAEAMITVEIGTGLIRDYEITSTLRTATGAWTYPYTQENLTRTSITWESDYDDRQEYEETLTRVNASWGYIFLDALVNSGQKDEWFRFQDRGLNVDLMSYSMSSLANNDQEALLDPKTLMEKADRTFAIFFKHFACFNVTEHKGGYVYVPMDFNSQDTSDLANAILSMPVEELRMSPAAAILSMSILVFLIIITIIMYTTNRKGYRAIPRDVSTLASTLGWIYASDRLLACATQSEDGTFTDSSGTKRWGIELVDVTAVHIMTDETGKDTKHDEVTAGEWLELYEIRHSATDDIREDPAPGAHERLLQSSDTENEAVGSGEECLKAPEPGNSSEDNHIRMMRSSSSDTGSTSPHL
ncbi:unnamed protein product [Aureobasidium vineae]|uniref:Uncharacterized protein n=1 Tax=Aureobasidium vineae TaxID=2773715 RepID=A0A9N8JH06_9PEZI|nr:unnamed protein product [Aureobasidium vineae]